MSKQQYESLTSAKGKAMWAKINNTVDTYEGKELGYTISIYFDEPTTKAMIADCNDRLEKAQEELVNEKTGKPKKWLDNPFVPYSKDEEGNIFFKFKTSHLRKDEEGNDVKKYVPVFDAHNKPIPHDVAIGNGSIVKINYSPSTYHVNANVNGIKMFANALQVLKLVEYNGGSNGSSFGFGEEESGYSVPVDPAEEIPDPFEE